jgi:hypothetical protein
VCAPDFQVMLFSDGPPPLPLNSTSTEAPLLATNTASVFYRTLFTSSSSKLVSPYRPEADIFPSILTPSAFLEPSQYHSLQFDREV